MKEFTRVEIDSVIRSVERRSKFPKATELLPEVEKTKSVLGVTVSERGVDLRTAWRSDEKLGRVVCKGRCGRKNQRDEGQQAVIERRKRKKQIQRRP